MQALIHVDDIRESLKAAGKDLRLAVEALVPFHSSFPPDAREDMTTLLRQMTSFRLDTRPSYVLTSQKLLHALTLESAGVVQLPTLSSLSAVPPHRGITGVNSTGDVLHAVHAALNLVGFSNAPLSSWVNSELFKLGQGAIDSWKNQADPIDSFHLLRTAFVLLRWSLAELSSYAGSLSNEQVQSTQSTTCILGEACSSHDGRGQRWARVARLAGADHNDDTKGNSPCFACSLGLSPSTLSVLEEADSLVDSFYNVGDVVVLNADDLVGLCRVLRMKCQFSTDFSTDDDVITTSPAGVLLLQYRAAELMTHAADCGHSGKLLEAGAVPALLSVMDQNPNAALRAAVATALRVICKDPVAREAAAVAGCLRPLARHLSSPHAGSRRAAARALGNVLVIGEGLKREAIERYGVSQSLVAMMRSDDVIAQEASSSALANLAANSEAVQTAVGKTGTFFNSNI